jgi:Protein of unknown function (DUF2934)
MEDDCRLTGRRILPNVMKSATLPPRCAVLRIGVLVRRPNGGRGNSEGRSSQGMPRKNLHKEQSVRDRAYFIWEREGRPDGRAYDHWDRAIKEASGVERKPHDESMPDEEKILAGRMDVNMPALLTKDVPGG